MSRRGPMGYSPSGSADIGSENPLWTIIETIPALVWCFLYDVHDSAKLLLGLNDAGQAEDLQRNAQGIAIIVDPRNDSHLLMAQMQVLFTKFHNRIVDWLREKRTAEHTIFTEAQRLVVWHYQWIILREFLPEVIGDGLTDALLAGGPRY